MIKITKSVSVEVTEEQAEGLFRAFTRLEAHIPQGYLGYDRDSCGARAFGMLDGRPEPTVVTVPDQHWSSGDATLIVAPVGDVKEFTLTSVSGTVASGIRSEQFPDHFQVVVTWEVIKKAARDMTWQIKRQSSYADHLGLTPQWNEDEEALLGAVKAMNDAVLAGLPHRGPRKVRPAIRRPAMI